MTEIIRKEPVGFISWVPEKGLVKLNEKKVLEKNLKYIDNSASKYVLGSPIFLTIYPSFMCNFDCVFCFNKFLNNNDVQIMTKKTVDNLLKYALDKGVFYIDILGGEPLLDVNWEITKYLIQRFSKANIFIYLTTNLSNLKKHHISFLENIKNFSLGISFMSTKTNIMQTITKSKRTILENIKLIDKSKITYGLYSPILKQNLKNLDDMLNFVNSLKRGAWLWRYPTSFGKGQFLLDINYFFKLFKKYKNKCNKKMYVDAPFTYNYLEVLEPRKQIDFLFVGCGAGVKKQEVLPNGDIYPCILFVKNKNLKIGNINKFVGETKKPQIFYKQCNNKECIYFNFCTGCPAYVANTNLSFDDRCIYRK